MLKVGFNPMFFEQGFGLKLLDYYFDSFEEQLRIFHDQAVSRATVSLQGRGIFPSSDQFQIELSATEHYTQDLFPQLFRSQLLVAIWSWIETSIDSTAKAMKEKGGKKLALKDIKSNTPRKQWELYFEHVIGSPLNFSDSLWHKIDDMREVRNVVAHTGVARRQISDGSYKKLVEIVGRVEGITVSSVEIELDALFIRNQLLVAGEVLDGLKSLFPDDDSGGLPDWLLADLPS